MVGAGSSPFPLPGCATPPPLPLLRRVDLLFSFFLFLFFAVVKSQFISHTGWPLHPKGNIPFSRKLSIWSPFNSIPAPGHWQLGRASAAIFAVADLPLLPIGRCRLAGDGR